MKRLFLKLAAAIAAGALISACGGNNSGDDQTPGSMIQVASRSGEISALVAAARKAGLEGELSAPGANLTVLAPTNDAFARLAGQIGFRSTAEMIDALPAATMKSILLYHVLPGRVTKANILAGGATQTTSLTQGAGPLSLAIDTSSGVRITDSVGRFAIVNLTDIPADNGLFHVIDRVLVPPAVLTVLQTVQSNPERFLSLANAAGSPAVVTALNGAGPFTLFAPTNAAFEAAAPVLAPLAGNQIDALLTYHVATGRVLASEIVFGAAVPTLLAGQTFTINAGVAPALASIVDTTATAAKVTVVDIIASNGVVHVIDKVLQPVLPAPI